MTYRGFDHARHSGELLVNGEAVLPELASAYLGRAWLQPGMITPEGLAVARARRSVVEPPNTWTTSLAADPPRMRSTR